MNITKDEQKLTIHLAGRIDSMNAQETEKEIMEALDANPEATVSFDAKDLAYISSAGLRVLMKVRKRQKSSVEITDVSRDVYDIFETTGFTELLNVKRAYRKISVDGLEVIGKGFYGTVYRIDPETIVKVYRGKDSIPIIENEKKMAQKAFLAGIPTAISYDIVQIGENYGSVFELINARTFHELAQKEEEPLADILGRYVALMKQVHATTPEAGTLPSYKEIYLNYLDVIKRHLTAEQYDKLRELLMGMPEGGAVVHGDIQMKNVMQTDDEAMLIDMETVGVGNPVFDLAGLYVTYHSFEEDDPDNAKAFLQMPEEKVSAILQTVFDLYFDGTDDAEKQKLLDRIKLVAAIRFLYLLEDPGLREGELAQKRIAHTKEHIAELLPSVDALGL